MLDSEIDSAIVLAYNPGEPGVEGALRVLETGGSVLEKGLIPLARELGIVNLLIDPGVVPMGSGAGASLCASPSWPKHASACRWVQAFTMQ